VLPPLVIYVLPPFVLLFCLNIIIHVVDLTLSKLNDRRQIMDLS